MIFRLASLAGGLLHRLLRETRGSIALKFALIVPAVAMLSVGAVDLMAVTSAQTRLQAVADAAALAAAPALALATDGAAARERAASFVAAELSQWPDAPTVVGTYEVVERGAQRGIRVLLRANRPSFFANMLPPGGWDFVGDATATSVGLVPLCVLNIATAGDRLLELATQSRIEAPQCLVHSNHTITVKDRSQMIGEAIQAVGSASGAIVPKAGTGAARIEDPFAKLPLDDPDGKCSTANVDRVNKRIRPGLHCAISITGKDDYTLEPGEHWFTDGALNVGGTATLRGEDVVLLIGEDGQINFRGNARINLTGRRTGPFAGIVIAALPEHDDLISINSSRVERLEGAIYVPNAILEIAGNADVARQSAWTVIVAASLMLKGSPDVFINANYGDSDVPVPGGVGPNAGGASRGGSRLIQ
ncbi:pilus assembly protein TadG-related protein [Brevundimonas sp.]|uniref:pilus assembly protein TadG-related protein n=1 Tax=Brevundimonas sp. TaxID=1871086 RepID=UPI00260CC36F|nr:pilus assembly protein TadG-related protein [Brevundimonas sp.]